MRISKSRRVYIELSKDSVSHWKFTGINEETGNEYEEVSDLPIGPPLDQFTGFLPLKAVTAVLADDFLENFSEFADLDGPFDKIVYLDRALFPKLSITKWV